MAENREALEAEARLAAVRFRDEHGLGMAPIADVVELAETVFGADVAVADMPALWDSYTTTDHQAHAIFISVRVSDNPERQRFSVAHEIAHLYYGELNHGDSDDPSVENRAETFARHLLIPQEALDTFLTENKRIKGALSERDLSDVVSYFQVSGWAAAIQLRETGWIDRLTYDQWWQIEASYLAHRYGWSSERNARVREASTVRPPKRMLANAIDAYVDHYLGLPSIAIVDIEHGIDEVEADLVAQGIEPRKLTPKRIDLDRIFGGGSE